MAIIPWKGKRRDGMLAPLADLRQEIDRMFDAFSRDPWGSLGELRGTKAWLPAVDIEENDQEVTVRAEVPGVAPEDLDISVTGNHLIISGEKKETSERREKDCYQSEMCYGSFSRTVELPSDVDTSQVTAEHANGVVSIRMRKTAAATKKKIEVKSA